MKFKFSKKFRTVYDFTQDFSACSHSLTQRLVSWSSPVVSKVWIKTQRVEKGQKMGRAEAIQAGDFQLPLLVYVCL